MIIITLYPKFRWILALKANLEPESQEKAQEWQIWSDLLACHDLTSVLLQMVI